MVAMRIGFAAGIAVVVSLGVAGQVVGRRMAVPSIILLLALGLAVGPVSGVLDPDDIFGEPLFELVSMAVGLLLFEESLKLDLRRLRGRARRPVILLVTLGAVLTGVGATAFAHLVLGLDWSRAAVIGAILIVSGPTVVGPLLRIVRPQQPVESILEFEGIFIDPIGAIVALTAANLALHSEGSHLGETTLVGIGTGVIAAAALVVVLRWGRLPAATDVAVAVAVALGAYAAAEAFHPEAGLFAATSLGVTLASQRVVGIEPLHEFGGHIGLILVGSLFILLAARVDLDDLARWAPRTLALVALLVLVLRPLMVAVTTAGSRLSWRERGMLAWMAPRGVVAASTASVFALRFDDAGQPFEEVVPVVFGVILATAVLYGLTGGPAARLLGVRDDAIGAGAPTAGPDPVAGTDPIAAAP